MIKHTVDEFCKLENVSVVVNEDQLSCILNMTDINNNKNRFYVLQGLKSKDCYYLFRRFGRIGDVGKCMIEPFNKEEDMIHSFKKLFKAKTRIKWSERNILSGKKYNISNIICNSRKKIESTINIPSKLNNSVQEFIKLISDDDLLKEITDFDSSSFSIGEISSEQIKNGIEILKTILIDLNSGLTNRLFKLSTDFYSQIPYKSGRQKPPIINSVACVDKMFGYVDNIIKTKDLIMTMKCRDGLNPIDSFYNNLNTEIVPLKKGSRIWKILNAYIKNSHGPTHNFTLEVCEMYEINNKNSREFKSTGNVQLLFHGSRLINWCSILKNGFSLDPQTYGAFISGKMYGYGIYFTNSSSKSAQYCGIDNDSHGKICLLLSEVSLGVVNKKIRADPFITKEILSNNGYDSIHGVGRMTPKSGISINNLNSVYIPNGKLIRSDYNSVLDYDEMVVYNTKRINPKYTIILNKSPIEKNNF